jgi:hypothetical protein
MVKLNLVMVTISLMLLGCLSKKREIIDLSAVADICKIKKELLEGPVEFKGSPEARPASRVYFVRFRGEVEHQAFGFANPARRVDLQKIPKVGEAFLQFDEIFSSRVYLVDTDSDKHRASAWVSFNDKGIWIMIDQFFYN